MVHKTIPTCPKYFLGLFDVLGFENKFQRLGLSKISKLYEALVHEIDSRNNHESEFREAFRIEDEAIWTAEGDTFVFNRINGAYASDLLLLWAHAEFPEARGLPENVRDKKAADHAIGWMYHAIPCERFLEACSELICHALEIGLPLRGALAMGPAILDEKRRIFLGQPLIDAARAEKGQRIVGASLSPSFMAKQSQSDTVCHSGITSRKVMNNIFQIIS